MSSKEKVNLKGLFEKGFQGEEFIPATKLELPCILKYLSHSPFDGKYGVTTRYFYENKNGEKVRLLCKGNNFKKLTEQYVPVGTKIILSKNESNYWMFELA